MGRPAQPGRILEFYDLLLSGSIAPGLVNEHILTAITPGLFGTSSIASFAAALFAGLFVNRIRVSFMADRFGRRVVFTASLLWYAVASAVMALQINAFVFNLWRFVAGIGVELVAIATYVSELVLKAVRGRAIAVSQTIEFAAVPAVSFVPWLLVPARPAGVAGWRWVILIGSASAVGFWFIRRRVPESPRWLPVHGQLNEAERVVAALERRVAIEHGKSLPAAWWL